MFEFVLLNLNFLKKLIDWFDFKAIYVIDDRLREVFNSSIKFLNRYIFQNIPKFDLAYRPTKRKKFFQI